MGVLHKGQLIQKQLLELLRPEGIHLAARLQDGLLCGIKGGPAPHPVIVAVAGVEGVKEIGGVLFQLLPGQNQVGVVGVQGRGVHIVGLLLGIGDGGSIFILPQDELLFQAVIADDLMGGVDLLHQLVQGHRRRAAAACQYQHSDSNQAANRPGCPFLFHQHNTLPF